MNIKIKLYVFLLIIILAIISTLIRINENRNEKITIEEISTILNQEIDNNSLKYWEIKLITKLDDGFTAPIVKIHFTNNIEMYLSISNRIYPDWVEKKININDVIVTVYTGDSKIAYKFKKKDIYYVIEGSEENEQDIKNYINSLVN